MLKHARHFGKAVELVASVVDGVLVMLEPQKQPLSGIGHAAVLDGYRMAQALIDERDPIGPGAHNRLARLTYSRTFGNQKVNVNSKRTLGSDEERRRVN